MIKKELIRIKVSDLVPYEKNPRKIPQSAVDDVRESIRQCGQLDPIEIDENNVILAGHTRRLAYLAEGIEEVDVIRYTGLTEKQKRKYRILANKTGERSTWDYELLDWELEDLDFEGYDFGLETPDIDWENVGDVEKEYQPPEQGKLRCPVCGAIDDKMRFKKVNADGTDAE